MSCNSSPDTRRLTGPCPHTPLTFYELPDIANTPFALHAPVLDRAALKRTLLSEQYTVTYGEPCLEELIEELSTAVQKTNFSFYKMLTVVHEDVRRSVNKWLESKPLGELSKAIHSFYLPKISA